MIRTPTLPTLGKLCASVAAFLLVLLSSAPLLRADNLTQDQQAIDAQLAILYPGKNYTVNSASQTDLVAAVSAAVALNSGSAAAIAAAAIEPYYVNAKSRGDKNTTGPLVVGAAITASGANASASATIASTVAVDLGLTASTSNAVLGSIAAHAIQANESSAGDVALALAQAGVVGVARLTFSEDALKDLPKTLPNIFTDSQQFTAAALTLDSTTGATSTPNGFIPTLAKAVDSNPATAGGVIAAGAATLGSGQAADNARETFAETEIKALSSAVAPVIEGVALTLSAETADTFARDVINSNTSYQSAGDKGEIAGGAIAAAPSITANILNAVLGTAGKPITASQLPTFAEDAVSQLSGTAPAIATVAATLTSTGSAGPLTDVQQTAITEDIVKVQPQDAGNITTAVLTANPSLSPQDTVFLSGVAGEISKDYSYVGDVAAAAAAKVSGSAAVLSIAETLIKKVSGAALYVSYEAAGSSSIHTDSTNQAAFAQALANAESSDAAAIAAGVSDQNNENAAAVVYAVVQANKTTLGAVATISGTVAKSIVAEDVDQITLISSTLAGLIKNGTLKTTEAATIATALGSNIPLPSTSGSAIGDILGSVGSTLVQGIPSLPAESGATAAQIKTYATSVDAVAKALLEIKAYYSTTNAQFSVEVPNIVGSLAATLASEYPTDGTTYSTLLSDLEATVNSDLSKYPTEKTAADNIINGFESNETNSGGYQVGPINGQETDTGNV